MSKIICDICGTSYPETESCCPVCGYAQNLDEAFEEDLIQEEEGTAEEVRKEIFDYDEVNPEPEQPEDEDEEDEEEEEEGRRPNVFLVIFLTILITALLAAAGFVYVRYIMPDKNGENGPTTQPTTAVEVLTEAPTTEVTIPCEILTLSSSSVAELNEIGQKFLLHVRPMPEDTTDVVIYTSGDESVATVSEDGTVVAVGEGETRIYISCGKNSLECAVTVKLVEDTVPPVTIVEEMPEVDPDATAPVSTEPAATVGVSTDVKLKLKKTDIQLKVYYYTTLELDCELQANAVEWVSEHPHIATVDENGKVTAVKSGTTQITARYGGQEASCIVRCVN